MNLLQRLALAVFPAALISASPAGAQSLEVDPHFIHYSNCAEQTALVTLPAVTLAGLLPAGFSFAPMEAGGQLAMVHVSGSSCADGGDGKPVSDVLAFVEVIPPPELQVPGLGAYGIFLRGWVQNPKTAASFAAWGFGDLVSLATVSVTVKELLGVRTGRTDASDARGGVSTRTTALGPEIQFPGARARLFRVKNGVVTAAVEGNYSAQTAKLGVGVMVQTGANFLPLPVGAATVSHAWGYDLSVESVPVYGP